MYLYWYIVESKGYRLYKPKSKKLIISRDVIFDEADEWSWQENLKHQLAPSYTLSISSEEDGDPSQASSELGTQSLTSPSSPRNAIRFAKSNSRFKVFKLPSIYKAITTR